MPRGSRRRAASGAKPTKLIIRTYQVGFGDCFLLTYQYPAFARHLLVDFGSTGYPKGEKNLLVRVAKSIKAETKGKLHVVVATHRHQDHVKGFGLKASAKIIRECKPDVVIQPWTEDPKIATDAKAPASAFRRRLANMNAMAAELFDPDRPARLGHLRGAAQSQFAELSFIGEDNIANKAAVQSLIDMGKAGRAEFVHAKKKLNLASVLPGVEVEVLGPPTIAHHPDIQRMRSEDEDEFWHLQAMAAAVPFGAGFDPFPGQPRARGGWDTRWLQKRLRMMRAEMLRQIVRILDDEMNNTSLILLFRAGGKSVLFPGDAQIENWEFALSDGKIRNKLKKVDVYKVGHHGSLNATPKSLWNAFEKKGGAAADKRLKSLLSTLEGKHGSKASKTEVPRRTLVTALESESDLTTTESYAKGELFRSVELQLG